MENNRPKNHNRGDRQRNKPPNKHNGIYVTGRVDGIAVNFLVDTGSSVTIISTQTYDRINEKCPDNGLEPVDFPLAGVDGFDLDALGKTTRCITLGNTGRRQQIVVANVSTDGILGIDFLRQNRCEVCLVRQVLRMDGEEILCWSGDERQNVCRVEIKKTEY
mgnify:CR=1 FL=1